MRELITLDDLNDALAVSELRPIFIFKHSTRCPVSAAAYEEVERYVQSAPEDAPAVYLIKVIEARPVSNAVAERLNLAHQSPQFILVHDHAAVWSTSHFEITGAQIGEAVEKARQLA